MLTAAQGVNSQTGPDRQVGEDAPRTEYRVSFEVSYRVR